MHAALFFYDDSFGLSFIAIGPRIGSHRKNTPFRRDAAHQEKTVSPLKIKVKIQKYTSIAIELFCFSAKIEQNSEWFWRLSKSLREVAAKCDTISHMQRGSLQEVCTSTTHRATKSCQQQRAKLALLAARQHHRSNAAD
jgi:hypothetical protein